MRRTHFDTRPVERRPGYTVIIVGWLALTAGLVYISDLAVAGGGAGIVGSILAVALGVGGLIAIFACGIGPVHMAITDSNAAAPATA